MVVPKLDSQVVRDSTIHVVYLASRIFFEPSPVLLGVSWLRHTLWIPQTPVHASSSAGVAVMAEGLWAMGSYTT